jgi:hypothetical protein
MVSAATVRMRIVTSTPADAMLDAAVLDLLEALQAAENLRNRDRSEFVYGCPRRHRQGPCIPWRNLIKRTAFSVSVICDPAKHGRDT